jgi:multimeric flavodoxin WrbA
MKRLLAINGTYRPGGTMDQAMAVVCDAARQGGAEVEVVNLRDCPIGFCQNCRHCTQVAGPAPGPCVQDDGMHALIEKIEAADALILASPTNFYSVTALFKRFMERLLVYAYWPWGMPAPKFRKAKSTRKAILIASSAAPGVAARWFYSTMKQLRVTARTLGARPVGSLSIGLAGQTEHPELDARTRGRIARLVEKLL